VPRLWLTGAIAISPLRTEEERREGERLANEGHGSQFSSTTPKLDSPQRPGMAQTLALGPVPIAIRPNGNYGEKRTSPQSSAKNVRRRQVHILHPTIQRSGAGPSERNGHAPRKPNRIDRTQIAARHREGAKQTHPKAKRPSTTGNPVECMFCRSSPAVPRAATVVAIPLDRSVIYTSLQL
jgi:hypothetical protein